MRVDKPFTGYIYHVYSRSIANFTIFNTTEEYERFINLISYYQQKNLKHRFSDINKYDINPGDEKMIELIAYCIMPTHFHLVLQQLEQNGIADFIKIILNSYTRYFNIKHNRKGPLWESRYKNVLVKNDEQLLHLTRYIHLNPVTAELVDKPQDWQFSSYGEYISEGKSKNICKYDNVLEINATSYKKFVDNRIDYQKQLAKLKTLILE